MMQKQGTHHYIVVALEPPAQGIALFETYRRSFAPCSLPGTLDRQFADVDPRYLCVHAGPSRQRP